MALEEGFDLHDELAKNEPVPGLDDVKEEDEDDGFDENGRKIDYEKGTVTYKLPENNDNIKLVLNPTVGDELILFNKNGRFANLNNLSTRATTYNVLRERLIKKFVTICKEDAEKQGKSRTHFCLFESALRWLTQYLDDENHIVGERNGRAIKLNTAQLKRLLASSDYELSEAQSTSLIKLAKKADILRQKGRGDTSYFIMNPIFNNGAYVGRISRKVLIEFNKDIKELFSKIQYRECIELLVKLGELPEDCFMENNDNEE
jgi:hypothetical protein